MYAAHMQSDETAIEMDAAHKEALGLDDEIDFSYVDAQEWTDPDPWAWQDNTIEAYAIRYALEHMPAHDPTRQPSTEPLAF